MKHSELLQEHEKAMEVRDFEEILLTAIQTYNSIARIKDQKAQQCFRQRWLHHATHYVRELDRLERDGYAVDHAAEFRQTISQCRSMIHENEKGVAMTIADVIVSVFIAAAALVAFLVATRVFSRPGGE